MLSPVRTVAPVETPVSLTEVKAHCRVDGTDSDPVLKALLEAAVDHLDGYTGILGRALVTQTWRQDFASFDCLRLVVGPVDSITNITYFDADNASQTLSTDVFALRKNEIGAYVDLKADQDWPGVYARPDAVSVTYVSGSEASDAPAAIKAAIMLLVSHWNENREAVSENAMTELPMAVNALIAPYRVWNI